MKTEAEYQVVISEDTLTKIEAYKAELANGTKAGTKLKAALEGKDIALISTQQFIEALMNTKAPVLMAEIRDISDWNNTEQGLLGRINVSVPDVTIYGNGGWNKGHTTHAEPFKGHLAFMPGLLMRKDFPDRKLVVEKGNINQEKYIAELTERLFPLLKQADEIGEKSGKKVIFETPAAGCGFFANEFRDGRALNAFTAAIEEILEKNKFDNIACIHMEEAAKKWNKKINGVDFVCDNAQIVRKGLLAKPSGEYADCTTVKLVGWDHFSHPGNEGLNGSYSSDDAAMVANTDFPTKIYGVAGEYKNANGYCATDNKSWATHATNFTFKNLTIVVAGPEGLKTLKQDFSAIQSALRNLYKKAGSAENFAQKILEISRTKIADSELAEEEKNKLNAKLSELEASLKTMQETYTNEKSQLGVFSKIMNWIKELFGYGLANEFAEATKEALNRMDKQSFTNFITSRAKPAEIGVGGDL